MRESRNAYTASLPARICLQLRLELCQLERLQRCYASHMAAPTGNRLAWLEKAIDRQQTKVRMLMELRSEERPEDCPEKYGLACADPDGGGCLWNRTTAYRG